MILTECDKILASRLGGGQILAVPPNPNCYKFPAPVNLVGHTGATQSPSL